MTWHFTLIVYTVMLVVLVVPSAAKSLTINWAIPTNPTLFTMTLADTLTFVYTNDHDVVLMDREHWSNCDFSQGTTLATTGPYVYTPSGTGLFYFSCSIEGHCDGGMSIQVNVTENSQDTKPMTPQPPASGNSFPSAPLVGAGVQPFRTTVLLLIAAVLSLCAVA